MTKIDRFIGDNHFLDNFFQLSSPMKFEFPWGIGLCKTSEHAFQAAKTLMEDEAKKVLAAPQPYMAKRLGRRVLLRPGWDDIKIQVMRNVLLAKFKDPYLRSLLLLTGDAILEEGNHHNDTFWGTVDGKGLNHLGKLLMKVRDEYRKAT